MITLKPGLTLYYKATFKLAIAFTKTPQNIQTSMAKDRNCLVSTTAC